MCEPPGDRERTPHHFVNRLLERFNLGFHRGKLSLAHNGQSICGFAAHFTMFTNGASP